MRPKEHYQQLLPGIPNEVTVDLIAPKLPWQTFHILSLVNVAWRRAIQSHQIYDARVRSQATEPVLLVDLLRKCWNKHGGPHTGIGVYSVRDKSSYVLPLIPGVLDRIYPSSQHISMNGKVYVISRSFVDHCSHVEVEFYVMDLAGQRQWKQCKSMGLIPTEHLLVKFGLGVFGGKIYVFGVVPSEVCPRSLVEVYDPVSNTWDPIKLTIPWNYYCPQVSVIGDTFFLYQGFIDKRVLSFSTLANFSVAYHPETGNWRKMQLDKRVMHESQFISQGKFHSITMTGIDVYDTEKNSWTTKHVFSSADIARALARNSHVGWYTVAVDNELVTTLKSCWTHDDSDCLLQSSGFGGRQQQIEWKKVKYPFLLKQLSSSLSIIQL